MNVVFEKWWYNFSLRWAPNTLFQGYLFPFNITSHYMVRPSIIIFAQSSTDWSYNLRTLIPYMLVSNFCKIVSPFISYRRRSYFPTLPRELG